MKILRYILLILALAIIVGQLIAMNFNDWSWASNKGSYLSIISMIMLIILLTITYSQERKKSNR